MVSSQESRQTDTNVADKHLVDSTILKRQKLILDHGGVDVVKAS
jgi:hypothetical protein